MKPLKFLVVAALIAGCYPATAAAPGPLDEQAVQLATARWNDSTEESLEQGRLLFIENCGYCHDHPDLHGYPADKWPDTVQRMAEDEAQLQPHEVKLVARFVEASIASESVEAE